MNKLLLFGTLFLGLNAVGQIQGTYVGRYFATTWMFSFEENDTIIAETSGHFGNALSKGLYQLSGDTVAFYSYDSLAQDPSMRRFEGSKYLIDGDTCIIDLLGQIDFCKTHFKPSVIDGDTIWFIEESRKRE